VILELQYSPPLTVPSVLFGKGSMVVFDYIYAGVLRQEKKKTHPVLT